MGRSKIKVEFIQDHKKRKSTLVNRKAGLVKKISELSILCDIKACMIIYEGNNHQMWPNDPNEVKELINLYKTQPFEGRSKRGKTLSNYFEYDQKKRAEVKVEKDRPTWDSRFDYFENDEKKKAEIKVEKDPTTWDSRFDYFENDEKKKAEIKVEKYPTWNSRFDYLSQKELQNLAGVVEKRMEKAKGKIELLKSMNVHIGSSSLSHQQIWDFPELMNNNNLMNHTTLWPISNMNSFTDHNNFFHSNIPISGVNSMGAGMDNGLLTIEDYQFCNANYSMMNEAENWSANDGIGSSSTMQPMANNGIGSSSTRHPMVNNGVDSSSIMHPMENNGVGSSSTMQPMGNNGIDSTSTMQLMENGIGSSLTVQPIDQYPFIYTDSTHDMSYGFV
ncbi:agamous-like MADS-box protein AGL80 [Solanum tuberosum]|uniref:Mads box protein n=1 Tax=Solanum tuberosum TaxID=4113 RepID=M1CN25_SOLTU|nr:PREDICTED: agamous-like MADS-box protein AGL80 [Solanum tuberosum]